MRTSLHPGLGRGLVTMVWVLIEGQGAGRGRLIVFKMESRLSAVIRPCEVVSISFWAPKPQRRRCMAI